MSCLRYFILLFKLGCFLFVGSDADCIEFIAEKRQREGIMAKLSPITAEGCVETCEDLNTCFAVNYFRLNATCQLLNRTMPESKLIKTTKCFYKAVRRPSQESIDNDPCFNIMCPWDEICMHDTATNLAECYTFCPTPPSKPGAINETTEVSVGQNYTYKCQNGLFMKGDQNPTVTCLQDGNWTSISFICARQNWMQDTIYPNNIQNSTEISNETGIDLLACMHQCDEKMNICLSFFYDNLTSRCILSSSFRRGLPQGYQMSNGFVYYTAPTASCDMGYINVSLGGSYFCIKLHRTNQTFNEGMKTCESEKAKLLIVTTEDQITDTKKFLGTFEGYVYIGVSDEMNEGHWVSWNGEEVSIFWDSTALQTHNSVNNCGVIDANTSVIGVIDHPCNQTHPFICCKNEL